MGTHMKIKTSNFPDPRSYSRSVTQSMEDRSDSSNGNPSASFMTFTLNWPLYVCTNLAMHMCYHIPHSGAKAIGEAGKKELATNLMKNLPRQFYGKGSQAYNMLDKSWI